MRLRFGICPVCDGECELIPGEKDGTWVLVEHDNRQKELCPGSFQAPIQGSEYEITDPSRQIGDGKGG